MKNILLTTFLITLFLSSCSNDDTTIEEAIADCKVLGTDGTKDLNLSNSNTDNSQPFTSLVNFFNSEAYTNAEIVFLTQYTYDSDNKLTSRIRYESTNYIGSDFKDTDNITYDSSSRIIEISTFNRLFQYTAVKVFEYNNSETLPSKLTRYRVDESENSSLLTYIETFTYNNNNQLIKVNKNYREDLERNPVETIYEYNNDENLTKIEVTSFGEDINDNWTSIETFENYDTQRNPLKGLPFSDVRGYSESNNNYFKYSKEIYYSYNPNFTDNLINISFPSGNSWEYTPTDLSYLETATYQCDE